MTAAPDELMATASAIAAYGLREAAPTSIAPSAAAWSGLGNILETERLSGIALAAADAGVLEMPDAIRPRLDAVHADEMMWALTLERQLGSVLDALARAQVSPVLLKGPIMAHLRYPDPSWRPFADLDLLVRGPERARASAALASAGYLPARPAPRPGFDDRFGKAVVHRSNSGVEIDLHRTLAQGPFVVWIDPDPLFVGALPFEVAGVRTRRLDDTGLLLHACVHASLGGPEPGLLMLRDVAQTWDAPGVDWDLLVAWARAWRLGAVLRRAISLTRTRLAVSPPPAAQTLWSIAADRRELHALRAYTGPRRAGGGPDLALLAALPGVGARARYAFSLLFPTREFLRSRARASGGAPTYRQRLTTAARRLGPERSI